MSGACSAITTGIASRIARSASSVVSVSCAARSSSAPASRTDSARPISCVDLREHVRQRRRSAAAAPRAPRATRATISSSFDSMPLARRMRARDPLPSHLAEQPLHLGVHRAVATPRSSRPRCRAAPPSIAPTRPPASSISSAPAATSHALQIPLPERVVAPGGDEREIERGAAVAPHRLRAVGEVREVLAVARVVGRVEARAHHRVATRVAIGETRIGPPLHVARRRAGRRTARRAPARTRRPPRRRPRARSAIDDAEQRVAVRVVGRAVERIDDEPLVAVAARTRRPPRRGSPRCGNAARTRSTMSASLARSASVTRSCGRFSAISRGSSSRSRRSAPASRASAVMNASGSNVILLGKARR